MLEGRCCTQCGESKPSSEFSWRGPDHKRLTSRCHACRRANHKENPLRNRQRALEYHHKNRDAIAAKQRARRIESLSMRLVAEAKRRANRKCLPFDLTTADVVVPEACPVLGIPLVVNIGTCGPNSPTLDRLRPELGYVRGNVQVISHRANTVKSDATPEELEAVLAYVKAHALAVAVIATGGDKLPAPFERAEAIEEGAC